MSVPILVQYFIPVIGVKGMCEVWCPWDQENCPQYRGVHIMDRDTDFKVSLGPRGACIVGVGSL